MRRTTVFLAALAATAIAGGSVGYAGDVKLPDTLVTTAYNTGTTGYSQMIAVGGMLKKRYGVNLRVLPGKNDVARLAGQGGQGAVHGDGLRQRLRARGGLCVRRREMGTVPRSSSHAQSRQGLHDLRRRE